MSSILAFLLLTLLQLATGFGLLNLFKITAKPAMFLSLCLIAGTGVVAFVPFLLQLCYVPLTATNIFPALIICSGLLNIKWKRGVAAWQAMWKGTKFRVELYELPVFLVIGFIIFVSAWRCFYFPPFPRDLTSGAEVIASYAVREKTMINSVFTVNLESTNNPFKPPFITSLQIIYKYAGFPFGQVWLISLFVSFIVFLYHALSRHLHKLMAGLLVVFFLAIPEMYAYTFMALFDYSNAVFFCIATYFLIEYLEREERNCLAFAGLMMGFAVYTRSETLVLCFLLFLAFLWHHIKQRDTLRKIMGGALWFLAPPLLFYLLPVSIYINFYLPVSYSVEGLVNRQLWNLAPFFRRFADMHTVLLFSNTGIDYYGYFIFIFLLALLLDLAIIRKWKMAQQNWLYAIIVVYIGLPFLGYLLPLMDLDNTTKRGLFKLFPLLLLYMGQSGILLKLSGRIKVWEKAR